MTPKAAVKTFVLAQGLYRLSALEDAPGRARDSSIVLLPMADAAAAQFLAASREFLRLTAATEPTVLQVSRERVEFQAISISGDGEPLDLKVESVSLATAERATAPPRPEEPSPLLDRLLLHVSGLGDVQVEAGQGFAALPAQTAVEGFGLLLGESSAARFALEYKALAASGAETPWVRGGQFCGTRGHGMPLTGLAFRVSATSPEACDCEYQVRFLSGQTSRAVRNGVPVKSMQAGDPIVAIRLNILPHAAAMPVAPATVTVPSAKATKPAKMAKPAQSATAASRRASPPVAVRRPASRKKARR